MVTITHRDALTPTEEILRAATETKTVIDPLGRNVTVGRFSIQRRRTMAKIVPAELQEAPALMRLATPAMCVQAIDGTVVPMPQSFLQLEALIDRLDMPGIQAVATAVLELETEARSTGDDLKNG